MSIDVVFLSNVQRGVHVCIVGAIIFGNSALRDAITWCIDFWGKIFVIISYKR